MLPTKRKHISFSELQDWKSCPNKHHLKHVQKINLYSPTVHTEFGTAVHEACENFLLKGEMDYYVAEKFIKESWRKNKIEDFVIKNDKEEITEVRSVEWYVEASKRALEEVPMFLDLCFPDWRVVSTEEQLYQEVKHLSIYFKGFVDAVIATGPEDDPTYYIFDWKTSENGWKDWKKKDEMTQYQPVYYREFWAAKNKIKRGKIKCGFVTLIYGKDFKGPRCELLRIRPTKSKRVGALKVLNDFVEDVTSDRPPKKITKKTVNNFVEWDNCRFCDYSETEYCDGWKK